MSQEEKKYRVIFSSTGMADRIALYVSHEAMRQVDWSRWPEIMLEVFRQDLYNSEQLRRHYLGEYPLLDDRKSRYLTKVTLQRDEQTQKWSRGYVRVEHLSRRWVYYAVFTIDWKWMNTGMPEIRFAKFKHIELTVHIPADIFEQEVSEPDFHCPRCDQGIHGNPKLCEKCGIELR